MVIINSSSVSVFLPTFSPVGNDGMKHGKAVNDKDAADELFLFRAMKIHARQQMFRRPNPLFYLLYT